MECYEKKLIKSRGTKGPENPSLMVLMRYSKRRRKTEKLKQETHEGRLLKMIKYRETNRTVFLISCL